MTWKVELDPAAERELDKLDPQMARRILTFLHTRVAALDDPRSIGEALKGPAGRVLEIPRRRLPDYQQH